MEMEREVVRGEQGPWLSSEVGNARELEEPTGKEEKSRVEEEISRRVSRRKN